MSTSPTSGRFIPLSTHYLETQGEGYETTLPSLLERSEQLAEEAREALPYSFDECTYSKGYLRQSVWSCIDCGEKGVCYGCSISCHAEHKLVELWTRRHFRCDCPTTSIPEVDGKRRKCTLNPPEAQPQQPNEENKYGTTFSGKFCRCGRDYDPETEVEAMVTCIGCEDWFHESCLNLIQPKDKVEEAVPDDEDEEKDVLIPSETYDGLICAACVNQHPLLVEHAGSEGWMIIEPDINGGFEVVGRPMPLSSKDPVDKGSDLEEIRGDADREQEQVSSPTTGDTRKRSAGDADVESNKRARQELQVPPTAVKRECQGKGDIFLAHGIRSVLQTTLPTDVAASLPFPLEDQDIYEPPQDNDQEETLEEVTSRVVGSLPRVQAIEALHGYQLMKDKLKSMLASHAQDGRAVSKDDIEGFFAQLQAGKRGI